MRDVYSLLHHRRLSLSELSASNMLTKECGDGKGKGPGESHLWPTDA